MNIGDWLTLRRVRRLSRLFRLLLALQVLVDIIRHIAHITAAFVDVVRISFHVCFGLNNYFLAELLGQSLSTRRGLHELEFADENTAAPVVEPQQALARPPRHLTCRLSRRTLGCLRFGLSLLLALALGGRDAGRGIVRRNHSTARRPSTLVLLCWMPMGIVATNGAS